MDAKRVKEYAVNPTAFLDDLQYPAGRFGDVAADFQRERITALAPALLAVAYGHTPDIGRFWWESTKVPDPTC